MNIHSIMIACDFSEMSKRALSFAANLAEISNAEIHLVHVHIDMADGRGEPVAGTLWPTAEQRDRYVNLPRVA